MLQEEEQSGVLGTESSPAGVLGSPLLGHSNIGNGLSAIPLRRTLSNASNRSVGTGKRKFGATATAALSPPSAIAPSTASTASLQRMLSALPMEARQLLVKQVGAHVNDGDGGVDQNENTEREVVEEVAMEGDRDDNSES